MHSLFMVTRALHLQVASCNEWEARCHIQLLALDMVAVGYLLSIESNPLTLLLWNTHPCFLSRNGSIEWASLQNFPLRNLGSSLTGADISGEDSRMTASRYKLTPWHRRQRHFMQLAHTKISGRLVSTRRRTSQKIPGRGKIFVH